MKIRCWYVLFLALAFLATGCSEEKKKDDDNDEEERGDSDDEEIVSDLDRTTELRELHLERMFSESGRFKAEGLTERKPK